MWEEGAVIIVVVGGGGGALEADALRNSLFVLFCHHVCLTLVTVAVPFLSVDVLTTTALFSPSNERLQQVFITCCGFNYKENRRIGKKIDMEQMVMKPRSYVALLQKCCLLSSSFTRGMDYCCR